MFRERMSFLWRDIFWWWIKIFIGPPFRLFWRTRAQGKRFFPKKGQAAFILANHTNTVDPFMIADFVQRPIRYVISDEYFRYKPLRVMLGWLKGIPKTKNIPDSVTMRELLKAVKDGELIGVFPEGQRNWDGETFPLEDTIPRLVQKLKIPVICVKQRGSYMSWPRWSNRIRRGRIIFEFSYLFENPNDIPDDPKEIKKMIENELAHSELEDSYVTGQIFSNSRVAEHLELRLWICPHCLTFFSLHSERNHFYCSKCGAKWRFSGDGSFNLERAGKPRNENAVNFNRYIDWAHWNDEITLPILEKRRHNGNNLLLEQPAKMWMAETDNIRNRDFVLEGEGTVALTKDSRIVFTRAEDDKVLLDSPLSEMRGANIAWNQKFEFFLPGKAFRLTFFGQSAYFWDFITHKLNPNNGNGKGGVA